MLLIGTARFTFVFGCQLSPSIVRDEKAVRAHDGVALVKSVDGIGSRAMKESTYAKLATRMPKAFHAGFKLFHSEDRRFGLDVVA